MTDKPLSSGSDADLSEDFEEFARRTDRLRDKTDELTISARAFSRTMSQAFVQATVGGKAALSLVERPWYENDYIPRVAKRGAEIIDARGASSAASAANAALEHMRDWVLGTPEGDWVSMGIPSDGSYGIEPGLMYSFPVTCKDGKYSIVQGLPVDEFSRKRMTVTADELKEERDAVQQLLA